MEEFVQGERVPEVENLPQYDNDLDWHGEFSLLVHDPEESTEPTILYYYHRSVVVRTGPTLKFMRENYGQPFLPLIGVCLSLSPEVWISC